MRVIVASLMVLVASTVTAIPNDTELSLRAESIRTATGSPAVGLAVFADGEIRAGVAGTREFRGDIPVQPDDIWHVGSNTKSMTATLVARLVEQGVVHWDDTIGEVLEDRIDGIHPAYADITYLELLSHTAGLPGNISLGDLIRLVTIDSDTVPVTDQRLEYARRVLTRRPPGKRGSFEYSNGGYIVAGAMLEATTGQTWEDLMEREVFRPMGLSSAGFGAPGQFPDGDHSGIVDQPRGHKRRLFGGLRPVPPGPGSDNPEFLGPAGTVHMSLEDLLTYLKLHLAGARGEETEYLSTESWDMLHTSRSEAGYALGWAVGPDMIMHNGSNTMWFVTMAFSPEQNRAVIVAFNDGRIRRLQSPTQELLAEFIQVR